MRLIITGAASGIGRAVALLAAGTMGSDCRLALVDREPGALADVAAEARALGASAWDLRADLSDPAACHGVASHAGALLGGLDALVSNAGQATTSPLLELDVAAFDRSFAVNVRPVLLLAQVTLPLLVASRGSVVATASISAKHPTPPLGAYSASKAALVALVQQMAVEWGPSGVRCNVVSPGPTLTGMTAAAFGSASGEEGHRQREDRERHIPLRQVAEPKDIASAIMFLMSPEARNITGVDLAVDGGLSQGLMPAVGGGRGHPTRRPSGTVADDGLR